MKKKTKKEVKKAWKDPEFEIHSLLDNDIYIQGGDSPGPCQCECECGDPGS